MCNGQHNALGGCQTLVEAEILGHSRWSSEPRAKFVSAANPATITRLVLMVQELQERLESAGARIRLLHDELVDSRQGQTQAIKHFRARAVRAIETLEIDTTHDHFYLTGYYRARGDARYRIKSLPLVETEEE